MKSKILVFKLQDIIKKGVFLIIGLIIICMIIFGFNKSEDTAYNTGTYQSQIVLHGKSVLVEVEIDKTGIKNILLKNLDDTQEVFYPTFNQCFDDISKSVIESQSTNIEVPQDYQYTGDILLSAIDNALNQARK